MEIFQRFREIISGCRYPFVIECGACDGYHSNILLGIIKEVDRRYIFHAFEPVGELLPKIISNVQGHLMFNNGTIGIFPNAVGAEDKKTTLYKSDGKRWENNEIVEHYYGSSSIRTPREVIYTDYPGMSFSEQETHVVRLDSHLEKCLLTERVIDFIWADVQGAEVDLIRGGEQAFEWVRYFYTEFYDKEYYEGQIGLEGILKLLPTFEVVENYGEDVLLKNKRFDKS